ncbi:MAG: SHOCT domain-containing protein [Candidatus Nanopelagicales bacterium]
MEFGQFLYSLIIIFFMIVYFMMLFNIIFDIFRDHEMNGFVKAIWLIFLLFIPLLSMLVYVIARGPGMAKRNQAAAEEAQKAQLAYAKQLVNQSGSTTVDQIADAQKLLDSGAITQAEFDQIKAKALAS